jgi:putative ABC transport system permease protein
MRLSNMAYLYRVRLQARAVLIQELFAMLGIAVGVALLFASQVASVSLSASGAQLDKVLAHSQYQLEARSTEGFSESLLGEVAALPGVRTAVPVLERETTATGPAGSRSIDLLATQPRFVHLAVPLARFSYRGFGSLPALSLPAPLAKAIGAGPLQRVTLQIGATLVKAHMGAELTASEIGTLIDSPIAFAPLTYAQKLTGMTGRLTRIFVTVQPGHDRETREGLLRLASGRINVEPADYDATLFNQAATPINQSTETFAAIAALVGFMFAYCSLLLTVPNRRALVRDLRHQGASRRVIVQTLLFDAVVLGSVASLLGLAIGELLSTLAFRADASYLVFAFPVGSQRTVTWSCIAIAVAAGMLSACLGVLIPLRRSFTRSGRAAWSRGQGRDRRWLVGMLVAGVSCLGVTTAIVIVAPGSAIVGVATLTLALLLLLPPAIDSIGAVLARLVYALDSGSAQIAVIELRASNARTWSTAIAATGAVAVFGSTTIEGSRANLQGGFNRLVNQLSAAAGVWVVPRGEADLLMTTPFSGVPVSTFASLPGVSALGAYRAAFLEYSGRRVWVLAPPPTTASPLPSSQLTVGQLGAATARLRAGGWAVLSQPLAHQADLHIGQSFTLPTPRPVTLRVAALSTNLGWPPGAIVLNGEDFAHAWESTDPTAYGVVLAPGASPEATRRALQRDLRPATGLIAETAREREHVQLAASRRALSRLTQIAQLVLVAGLLAAATSMSAMIWQRRRRFARMKTQGIDTRTLWLALLWESGMLVGSGCLVGAVFGIYGQLLLSHALSSVTGYPIVFSANAQLAAVRFMLVTVVAAAIIAIPGYRAAHVAAHPWESP